MAETEIIIRPQTDQNGQGKQSAPIAPTVLTAPPTPSVQPVQTGQAVSAVSNLVPAAVNAVPVNAAVTTTAVPVNTAGSVPAVSPVVSSAANSVQQAGQISGAQETLLTKALLSGPEYYVFQFAPETVVDTALIDEFKRFAFEQKMSLENARLMAKFYEKHVLGQSKKQSQEQAELLQSMQKACEEDSEFGGMNFYDNMRYAKAAVLRFDDGSLAKILNDTGFGSHPEVVRFMYRVGKALAEKEMPLAKESTAEKSAAELFYPSMVKN